MADPRYQLAMDYFQQGYQLQMDGDLDLAADFYKRSIEMFPTAEAYTFLGWTYRFQGKLDEAIEECKNAILIDPTFGNPYNDIGAYLIEKGKFDEAISWLEKATLSKRYDAYHFPWYNLGRAYAAKELYNQARSCFERALAIEPAYVPALDAVEKLRRMLQ
jgi:Tfp pilus assembly protein PilF